MFYTYLGPCQYLQLRVYVDFKIVVIYKKSYTKDL